MSTARRTPFLLGCLLLVTFLPALGAWLKWRGAPPGYGIFPPVSPGAAPAGTNAVAVAIAVVVTAGLLVLVLAPRLLGFAPARPVRRLPRGPFPHWFVPGLALTLISWGLMWFGPAAAARFTFVPLWWGFILVLDGAVFALTHGRSLLASRRQELLVLAVVSVVGWFLFEYWNYFVLGNWFYPHAGLLSPFGNLVWFSLSYTTVWPSCFEWYMLLAAIPALRLRWTCGPRVRLPRPALVGVLLAGFGGSVLMGLFPSSLFWLLWVASVLVFAAALELAQFWTPFVPARGGDWSRFVLMGLATLVNGFVWEFWNYGSEAFRHGAATNPNYWVYSIPYVNVVHLFSEMPLLGYAGYAFFGLLVWVYWLVIAHVVDVDPDFAHAHHAGPSAAADRGDHVDARAGADRARQVGPVALDIHVDVPA